MVDRIRILSDSLANMIAAGEVVERPASVLKELLENSLDAGAGKVEIDIGRSGKRLVRVADDGWGLSPNDAVAAFDRHATSKIQSVDNLKAIGSFGFRGEALPSIAAVSRVTLLSQPAEEMEGTKVVIHGGVLKKVEAAGRAPGTTVNVEQIFFNTPARRRFLKGDETEFRRLLNVVTSQAMVLPGTSFRLTHNDREVISFGRGDSWESRIRNILGGTIFDQLLPVDFESDHLNIRGYVSPPDVYRSRGWQPYLAVNRRPISSPLIIGILSGIYTNLLPRGSKPVIVLQFEMDQAAVDVNVHPAKLEVRFREERATAAALKEAVEKSLAGVRRRSSADLARFTVPPPIETPDSVYRLSPPIPPQTEFQLSTNPPEPAGEEGEGEGEVDARTEHGRNFPGPEKIFREFAGAGADSERLIWQLHESFIMAQVRNGLVIIDQHAAHERVLYEEMLEMLRKKRPVAQRLLFPDTLEIPLKEWDILNEYKDIIEQAGFSLRVVSERVAQVDAIPASIRSWDNGRVLLQMLDQLATEELPNLNMQEKLARAFACQSAVKLGAKLTATEMFSLFDQLFATKNPNYCPHGRPTLLQISLDDLYRRFERK